MAFVCVENSCRSQMAEALARFRYGKSGIVFSSAGTHPADAVDAGALRLLESEGIQWSGRPKHLDAIQHPDVIVTMGCDVACPTIPGARVIVWNLPDPKGKSGTEYRRVFRILQNHLAQLVDALHHQASP